MSELQRNYFEAHEIEWVQQEGPVQSLEFFKRTKDGGKDWDGRMFIHIHNHRLIVTGDYGDAVYVFSSRISFTGWERVGIGYFSEKCSASEDGYGFKSFDSGYALKELLEALYDHVSETEEDWEDLDDDKRRGLVEDYVHRNAELADLDYIEGACDSEFEYLEVIRDYGYALLGDCYADYDGRTYSPRCRLHLQAMQAISKLLTE